MSDQGCNLVGQWQILVGHCPMTDRYLQPCTNGDMFMQSDKIVSGLTQGYKLTVSEVIDRPRDGVIMKNGLRVLAVSK